MDFLREFFFALLIVTNVKLVYLLFEHIAITEDTRNVKNNCFSLCSGHCMLCKIFNEELFMCIDMNF